jgi:hypothetical protein
MRFAWLREQSANEVPVRESLTSRIIMVTWNVVWWLPIALVLARAIDYRSGTIAFFAVTMARAVANVYRNNVLDPEQAAGFPLRSP